MCASCRRHIGCGGWDPYLRIAKRLSSRHSQRGSCFNSSSSLRYKYAICWIPVRFHREKLWAVSWRNWPLVRRLDSYQVITQVSIRKSFVSDFQTELPLAAAITSSSWTSYTFDTGTERWCFLTPLVSPDFLSCVPCTFTVWPCSSLYPYHVNVTRILVHWQWDPAACGASRGVTVPVQSCMVANGMVDQSNHPG